MACDKKDAKTLIQRADDFWQVTETRPFEEILAFIQEGIDPTHIQKDIAGNWKAIDFILTGDSRKLRPPLTEEQRLTAFKALADQTEKPLARMISGVTMGIAASWGRLSVIPELVAIGGCFQSGDFPDAGSALDDPQKKLEVLQALLPYFSSVNARSWDDGNAGHKAAQRGEYDNFLWLESQGLDKTEMAPHRLPTYAHCLASGFNRRETSERLGHDPWPLFLAHLQSAGYPLDANGKDGRRPVHVAAENGHLDLAQMFLDAGAVADTSLMTAAAVAVYCNNISQGQALEFMMRLHDRHGVPYAEDTINEAYRLCDSCVRGKRVLKLAEISDIVCFLRMKGAAPDPAIATSTLDNVRNMPGCDRSILQKLGSSTPAEQKISSRPKL